jgi:hypothetical protein
LVLSLVPAAIYTNPDLQKKRIIKENKGKSGIYRWINQKSGKDYIGSSVDFSIRLREYYCLSYLERFKKSSIICNALQNKGYSSFMAGSATH